VVKEDFNWGSCIWSYVTNSKLETPKLLHSVTTNPELVIEPFYYFIQNIVFNKPYAAIL